MTDLITKVNAGGNDEKTNGSSKGVKRVLVDMENKNNSTKKRVKKWKELTSKYFVKYGHILNKPLVSRK